MNVRDVLAGAVASLVVTVGGGVSVYYLTREPPKPAAREDLQYQWTEPVAFESDDRKLTLTSLRVANVGEAPADEVVIAAQVNDGRRLEDSAVSLSSGPAGTYDVRTKTEHSLQVVVPSLTPGETATVSLLLKGLAGPNPKTGVKSHRSTGAPGALVTQLRAPPTKRSAIRDVAALVIPLAAFAQLILLVWAKPRISAFLRTRFPTGISPNNTAFLYIHSGLVEDGGALLKYSIDNGGADPHMLSNYALAMALLGDVEGSAKRFDAARIYSETKHERAVYFFSLAVAQLTVGNTSDAIANLQSAFSLSRKEVREYCGFSCHIASGRRMIPELDELLRAEEVVPNSALQLTSPSLSLRPRS